eukprot:5214395-Prymnesium_polylepis.1
MAGGYPPVHFRRATQGVASLAPKAHAAPRVASPCMAESLLPGVDSSAVAPSAHLTPRAYGQQGERIIALARGPL